MESMESLACCVPIFQSVDDMFIASSHNDAIYTAPTHTHTHTPHTHTHTHHTHTPHTTRAAAERGEGDGTEQEPVG